MHEKCLAQNVLGTVTKQKLVLNLVGGEKEFFFSEIEQVQYKHVRYLYKVVMALSIAFLTAFFGFINTGNDIVGILVVTIVTILFCMAAMSNWYGHHEIIIRVNGMDLQPIKVEMAYRKEAKELIDAIEKVDFVSDF